MNIKISQPKEKHNLCPWVYRLIVGSTCLEKLQRRCLLAIQNIYFTVLVCAVGMVYNTIILQISNDKVRNFTTSIFIEETTVDDIQKAQIFSCQGEQLYKIVCLGVINFGRILWPSFFLLFFSVFKYQHLIHTASEINCCTILLKQFFFTTVKT